MFLQLRPSEQGVATASSSTLCRGRSMALLARPVPSGATGGRAPEREVR